MVQAGAPPLVRQPALHARAQHPAAQPPIQNKPNRLAYQDGAKTYSWIKQGASTNNQKPRGQSQSDSCSKQRRIQKRRDLHHGMGGCSSILKEMKGDKPHQRHPSP